MVRPKCHFARNIGDERNNRKTFNSGDAQGSMHVISPHTKIKYPVLSSNLYHNTVSQGLLIANNIIEMIRWGCITEYPLINILKLPKDPI